MRTFPKFYHAPAPENLGSFWRINDWKKAFKKIHGKIMRATGLSRIGFIRKLDNKITGAADKLDKKVSQNFMGAKKWAQKNRKALQVAAAVAGAAVGGYYLYSAYSAGAAGAGSAGAAGAGTAAGTTFSTSALAPIGASATGGLTTAAAIAPGVTLTSGVISTGSSLAAAATGAAGAAASSGFSLVGALAGTGKLVAALAPSLLAIKAAGAGAPAEQPIEYAPIDPGMVSGGGAVSGGGGGIPDAMNPEAQPGDADFIGPVQPEEAAGLSPWLLAGGAAVVLALVLMKKKKRPSHA